MDRIRYKRLYDELQVLLNNAPAEGDCPDDENRVYAEMQNLCEALVDMDIDKEQLPKPNVDEYMTVGEFCRILHIRETTVYHMIKMRKLPAVKFGRRWKIPKRALTMNF